MHIVAAFCAFLMLTRIAIEGARCRNEEDCELNGDCDINSGTCQCYQGWKGENCGQLDLAPIKSYKIPGYVPKATANSENVSCSWGGNIIKQKIENKTQYSIIAAAMQAHCGIDYWTSNSEIIHAVGDAPEGPYVYKETLVPRFAHEPNVVRAPDGALVMFFTWCDCDPNKLQPPTPVSQCETPTRWPWSNNEPQANTEFNKTGDNTQLKGILPGYFQTWMRISDSGSPSGPWGAPIKIDLGNACKGEPDPNDTNFNAAIYPNGTLVGLWRCVETLNTTQPRATVIHTVIAENYRDIKTYRYTPYPAYLQREFGTEDPTVWIDTKGHVHAILHDEDECCPPTRDTAIGKHAWSRDGVSWSLSSTYAYNHTVEFADGHPSHTFLRRERPHIYIEDGRLMFLTNGAQPYNDTDKTFTLIQPIR
eukprot:m.29848 g.29848  ORF g.29848 m.29848 type:complete len:421 (+) comp8142_c0_seq2:118-1380(+)